MNCIVRVWIGDPHNNGHFNGTAFFVDGQRLITAKHVVVDSRNKLYQNIFLSNTPDAGVTPVENVQLCERDVAILTVKKTFNVEHINFKQSPSDSDDVEIIGFQDQSTSQKKYKSRVSGYDNLTHTYELQNHLASGLSGSPVFIGDKVCGITQAISRAKNITYVIPISEACIKLPESTNEVTSSYDTPKKGVPRNLIDLVWPVRIPFTIILLLSIFLSKVVYPRLELIDSITALILTSLVLAILFNSVLKKYKGRR